MKDLILRKGLWFYAYTVGAFFSALLFIGFAFIYAMQGIELTVPKLSIVLAQSLVSGVLWVVATWLLVYRKAARVTRI